MSLEYTAPIPFSTEGITVLDAAYDTINKKLVIVFIPNTGIYAGHACAIVGTVSKSNITFGGITDIDSSALHVATAFDETTGKFVVSVKNSKCYVGTVSGDSISFGASAYAPTSSDMMLTCFNGKVASVRTISAQHGYVNIGEIGSTVSWGTEVLFHTATIFSGPVPIYDEVNDKLVLIYNGYNSESRASGMVCTVSGTTVTIGTHTEMIASSNIHRNSTYDGNTGKIISFCEYLADQWRPSFVEGIVSGTSILFSTPQIIGDHYDIDGGNIGITFNSDNNEVSAVYQQHYISGYLNRVNINSESLIAGPAVLRDQSQDLSAMKSVFDPDSKQIASVFCDDSAATGNGFVILYSDTDRFWKNNSGQMEI